MTAKNRIEIRQAGLTKYASGLQMQADAAAEVRSGALPGIIITIRHPNVITMGRRAVETELHANPERLAELGIELFKVDRGGGATYHYPQQAVLYPILDLPALKVSVPELLRISGDAVMEVLTAHGVHGVWDESKPGVYMPDGAKIASVGYHLSKGLTTHGIAVNIGEGLQGFDLIDPCKVRNQAITSVLEVTGRPADPDAFALSVAQSMARMLA